MHFDQINYILAADLKKLLISLILSTKEHKIALQLRQMWFQERFELHIVEWVYTLPSTVQNEAQKPFGFKRDNEFT